MRFAFVLLGLVLLAGCVQVNVDERPGPMGGMHDGMMAMHDIDSEEEFIVEMIPHHQEAVDTARVIADNSENEQLVDLANRIVAAQTAEIAMMRGWLDEWYDGGYEPQYQQMMPPMTPYQGADTDVAFLQGMIMHHRMAVMMARQAQTFELHDEVADFADDVIRVQTAEINEMMGLLRAY